MDIFERIKQDREGMSNSYGKVADFMCSNYEDVAFMSVTEVARRVGVNESVVVRFAASLGYSGFTEMKKQIARRVKNNLMMPNRMLSVDLSSNSSEQEILSAVLNKDINNIVMTLKSPYNLLFDQVVKNLREANKVYIIGNRGLYKVAELMTFLLDMLGIDCMAINAGDSAEYQKIRMLKKNCILVAFSFPRYDKHINSAVQRAKKNKAGVLVLSDSVFSPDAKLADWNLTVSVESHTFINSYCAIISMVNAIVTAIGIKYRDETLSSLNEIEKYMDDFEISESYTEMLDNENS